MKRTLLLAIFSSLLFSCEKEKEEIKFAHTGTWKFAGATATHSDTYVSQTADIDSIVNVYSSSFSDFDGSVDITATAWNFTASQYTCEGKIEASTHANGSITKIAETASNDISIDKNSMKFKVINADSVYFYSTEIPLNDVYYWPSPMLNTGATITVSGDTMRVHIIIEHYDYGIPHPNRRPGRLEKTITYVR